MYPLCDKRVFLWVLFVVQVCLIGGVLIFSTRSSKQHQQLQPNTNGAVAAVEFVHRSNNDTKSDAQLTGDVATRIITVGRYEHEFVGKHHCFRDGLARRPSNRSSSKHHTNASPCVCKPDYHGSDCGQPEVLWRAFMTAKMPLKLAAISRRQPHNIFYLIHPGTAIAIGQLETLEIQILELVHVVDVFVLCGTQSELRRTIQGGPLKPFAKKILVLAASTSAARKGGGCSLRTMYAQFRQHFASHHVGQQNDSAVRTDDVLLASGPDEILNWRAVKYFKWYDHWPQPAQFRLKYLVYGYYWQHPQSTWLAGGASQLSVLEEVHRGDPRRLVVATKPGMIVGDLNHVGGWYCQYCYHPLNVVRRLVAERTTAATAASAGNQLDGSQVEKLIANGLFVDGKLGLTRLHRFADKYYAPECVRNASWRYEGVLSNVYATYDDDYAK